MKTILTTLGMLSLGLTLIFPSVSCEQLEDPEDEKDTVYIYVPDTVGKDSCEKNNTGNFCFTTSDFDRSYVYIFNNTDVQWGSRMMTLSEHQTQCFYALKAGVYDYEVYRFAQPGRDQLNCLSTGQINVVKCKTDTLVLP